MSKSHEKFPKLSSKEYLILDLLINRGEMFGLEMANASDGELQRGAIYVYLSRMSDKGYIESRKEPREFPEIGIPRRKYKATGLGEKAFQAHTKAIEIFNDLAWGVK